MKNPLNLREIAPLDQSKIAPWVLTVDVEEWYDVNYLSANRSLIDTNISRVKENTAEILKALEESGSKATFFVLGSIAEKHPELIRSIARAGHEIGCHSYRHSLIYDETPKTFQENLQRAAAILSDLAGQKISGFRAPSCSITEQCAWALDVLCECGFQYDSSIFPIPNYMYGVKHFPVHPCRITTSAGNRLIEIPPQVMEFGRLRIPFGGGIYLRLLPTFLHRKFISLTHARGRSYMLYFHPSDIDKVHMHMELSLKERLFNDIGRRSGRKKIMNLLATLRWTSVGDAYSHFLS
jgi:polysaccharide deacetylase family protein (PEP-CTERM system associated)